MKAFRAARAACLTVFAIASGSLALAQPAQTRVTIRGTGSNVTLDRGPAPARPASARNALPAGALDEAVRLKASGADDTVVIAYLHAHEKELPAVIEAEDVRRLRNAGAGKSVINFLSTVSAVDIGPTGEGHPSYAAVEMLPPPDVEPPVYAVPYGYPAGAYAAPYPGRIPIRSGFGFRRMARPSARPLFLRHQMSSRPLVPFREQE